MSGMMISRSSLKESFDVDSRNAAFYTGGKVKWSNDGSVLFSPAGHVINVIDLELGRPKTVLGNANSEDGDLIYCFTNTDEGNNVVTSHKSGLFRYWDVTEGSVLKLWKSIHQGPVAELEISQDGNILASGGSDSVIRIWDLPHNSCTHALRGSRGVINVLRFHTSNQNQIFGCGDDLKISCWDLKTSNIIFQLSGHYSKITALSLHHEEKYLVSCGRDRVLMLWDLETKSCIKTLPVFESLEDVVCLPNKFKLPGLEEVKGTVNVATAGEKGLVRVFEMTSGRELFTQRNSLVSVPAEEGGLAISQLLFNLRRNWFAVITADHNMIFHNLETFNCEKQLVGFSDEILDIVYVGPSDSHIGVATNSCDIKLYNVAHMGCQLLKGHTGLVLSLSVCTVNNCWMISAAKDNTVRLWELDNKTQIMSCLVIGSRHTASVSAVCFSRLTEDFFLSASHDTTLKLWSIKSNKCKETKIKNYNLTVQFTQIAHNKDINCVRVSPNDKLAASASQDKTVKLWTVEDLSLVGTLRGHRRGVWCVQFSPVDKVLLSSSADCTIKIWSVTDLSCLKTFEGHESSVLRVEFLSKGMQIISASGDGLLKLWEIKNSECVGTFDEHTGKIWALAVSNSEEKLVTGGSDSLLIFWRDSTEEKREALLKAREEMLLQEQHLSNLIHNNQLFAALSLALSLDKPFKVLSIVKDLIKADETEGLKSTLKKLTDLEKEKLLKCASTWNSNSKNCDAAQVVISILLEEIASGSLKLTSLPKYVEEMIPYTERHFKRLTGLLENLHFLEYTLAKMNPVLK